jgi:hypothetical protein
VLEDVRFGYVSVAAAASAYGVVLREGRVDMEATRRLRAQLAAQRTVLRVRIVHDTTLEGARLILDVAPATARELGVADGDLVDLPRADGPSLLAWTRVSDTVAPGECGVPAWALALLGVRDGDSMTLRCVPDRRSAT